MVGFENKMYSENNASPVGDNGHTVSSLSPAVVDMEITEEPLPGPSAGIHVDTDDPGSNLEGEYFFYYACVLLWLLGVTVA